MQKIRQHPIILLLIINIMVGLFTFRDYGLSWDEPLFYDYANALGYAYSPREWFSGDFNLENAFGSSAADHANRGPAYILIAHPLVSVLEAFKMDNASTWHLVNFLTFQFGVYLFYRLSKRWMTHPAAFAASALFAWQPLLWGHAFINPKDPPFLVFFLGAVLFGFEMIDNLEIDPKGFLNHPGSILLASFFLGSATSIRVLGPLAGLLVTIYAFSQLKKITTPVLTKNLAIYAAFAILIAFVTWPYLWTNPLQRFIEVFGFMSDNPTQMPVLFNGRIYHADELPRRYLPILLSLTLTEPVLPLFLIGFVVASWKKFRPDNTDNRSLIFDHWLQITDYVLLLLWFIIPFGYVIFRRPPMYDGYRHFLFMLPPIFIFAGFAFEKLFDTIKTRWISITLMLIMLAPAVYDSIQLHPYQYAYYNSIAGGTSGAFRSYETEYWLTCYREAVMEFEKQAPKGSQLFVKREPAIAEYYASSTIDIRDYRTELKDIQPGDFVLMNTRANEDEKILKDAPVLTELGRGNAIFCVIKQVP